LTLRSSGANRLASTNANKPRSTLACADNVIKRLGRQSTVHVSNGPALLAKLVRQLWKPLASHPLR
jgi:hypothetical protein